MDWRTFTIASRILLYLPTNLLYLVSGAMLTSTSRLSRAAARESAPAVSLRKALVAKPALLPARNAFAAASPALAAAQKATLRSSALYQRHSRARAAVMASAVSASSQDLLIVGPGVLGSYLGKLWKDQYPNAAVTGQTNSATNHDRSVS